MVAHVKRHLAVVTPEVSAEPVAGARLIKEIAQALKASAIPVTAPPTEDFIEELYLALNPDIRLAVMEGREPSGRAHWERVGRDEEVRGARPTAADAELGGHRPKGPEPAGSPFAQFGPQHVEPEAYLYAYPDVRGAIGPDPKSARQHWLDYGKLEGRLPGPVAPFAARICNPGRLLDRGYGLNVYGPFSALSGLGTAARGMVRAMHSAGIPLALWNLDTSRGQARISPLDRARAPVFRANVLLCNADQLPHVFGLFPAGQFDDGYNIGVWQWELPAFRPDWHAFFGALDEVWTNSEFQVNAIRASSPVPVTKVHLPVRAPVPEAVPCRAKFGIPEDAFVFLLPFDVSSSSARKNPFAAIEAFRAAFPENDRSMREDDATDDRRQPVLVLKYHSGRAEPAFLAQLARAVRGMSNVLIIADQFPPAQMAALQIVCDALISPHRSEGFGLNIAEFLAMGKPVVATNYSGNVDFFDESVGFPVDYKLGEVGRWTGPYSPHYIWAEPDKDSLRTQLRAVLDFPAESARRGRAGAERMAERFSDAAVGQAIKARLEAVGLDAAPIPFLRWAGEARAASIGSVAQGGTAALPYQDVSRLPLLSVIVPVWNVPGALLEACIASVKRQTYGFWELCLCNDGSTREDTLAALDRHRGASPRIKIRDLAVNSGIVAASNAAAEMSAGEFIVLLDNDDELHPEALMEVARALSKDPELDCLYTDEERVDLDGCRIDHFHKPDWSPEHLESVMYVLHMLTIRKRLFLDVGGFRAGYDGAQDYDLMLRCSRGTDRIHHIAKALYRWRAIPGSSAEKVDAKPTALEAGLRALGDHARTKYGPAARVEKGLTEGTFRLRRPLALKPRVSLVILTANQHGEVPGQGRMSLVDNFVRSIREKTEYSNYEIIVVDNGALTPEQIAAYRLDGVVVEDQPRRPGPFNFAAKANFAIRKARSEHLVLLNDDMEIISPDWLGALMEFAQDPEIGIVGARLLHADGSIQHVGTVIGVNGGAAHPYHCYPRDFVGYNAFTHVVRNYAAVTAACMATRRSVLAQVGGFDEGFAIDYNDVDLCLRVIESGYRVVYTPYAELYHFEGQSAKRASQNPEEVAAFRARWGRYLNNDPYYNPNLTRVGLDYALRAEAPIH